MELILLGTGTSTGVPEVACGCAVCQSTDPRDKRQRCSALLITSDGYRILIDCSPDFHRQACHIGLDRLDAVLLTHEHYDHVYGLDDLRTLAQERELPIYAQTRVLEAVRDRMHYVFGGSPYPGAPRFSLHSLDATQSLCIGSVEISPILVLHGKLPIYGYRFQERGSEIRSIGYVTDMKQVSPKEWSKVEGLDLCVINALRLKKEHPSHQSILDVQLRLSKLKQQPKLSVLTHLSHHAPEYIRLEQMLQGGLIAGYDYMHLRWQDGRYQPATFNRPPRLYSYTNLDTRGFVYEPATFKPSDLRVYLSESSTVQLLTAISRDEVNLLFCLSLPGVWSYRAEELYIALIQGVARWCQIDTDQVRQCVCVERLQNADGTMLLTLQWQINQQGGSGSSLRSLSQSAVELDMFVIKAQMSTIINKQLKKVYNLSSCTSAYESNH